MNVSTARGWVRQFARNAQDSSLYSDADIDRVIQAVCSRFCRKTKAIISASTVDLAIDDASITLDADPLIKPSNLKDITLSDACDPLTVMDYADFNRLRQTPKTAKPCAAAMIGNAVSAVTTCNSAGAGTADKFAVSSSVDTPPPPNLGAGWRITYFGETRRVVTWDSDTLTGTVDEEWAAPMEGGNPVTFFEWPATSDILLYPTNDAVRTATARFWLPFTTWSPGVVDATAQLIELIIPDDWLAEILPLGPPGQLQLHEPENVKQASAKWAAYEALEQSFMGAGILGKKVAIRRKRC